METAPRFPLVVVDVEPHLADDAGAQLFELGATGVEERDGTTLAKGAAGKITLVASFADEGTADAACAALAAEWGARKDEIVGDGWRDAWKTHFRPFELFPGFVVRPPWEEYGGPAREIIVLEPGRAFGTGLHETTSLVAQVLAANAGELAGATILDVGCGSGILAIIALKLGAGAARAVDIDPEAILVTRENAAQNGFEGRVSADTTPIDAVDGRYVTVVANVEAGPLCSMAPALMHRVAPGGMLVLSGILAPDVAPTQVDQVCRAYAAFELEGSLRKGEWVAMTLRAPKGDPR